MSVLSDDQVAALALELHQAEKSRVQIEHFSKRFAGMTIEDGYRINRAWMQLQYADGHRAIGHKIGLTSRAMQQSSQIDEPDYGTLLDYMRYDCTPGEVLNIPVSNFIAPRVEVDNCGPFEALGLVAGREGDKAGVGREEGFEGLLAAGFVDSFRMFEDGPGHYTWWSYRGGARANNKGWRIDYFLVSQALKKSVKAADIHADVMGSDHCPVSITLA